MFSIVTMLDLSGVGFLLVGYGTVARNRWGINIAAVSCPNCRTPFTRLRKSRSLKQTLWGGHTCTACRTEIDKWGRQIMNRSKLQNDSKKFWTQERNMRVTRLRDVPAVVWVLGGILLALNLWWDLHHTGGFVLNVVFLILLLIFYLKHRKRHRNE
jgi:hypothetical protein